MADENGGTKVIWFLAGAAIGATIALLYAPEAGHVTRRRIVKKTREGRDAIAEGGQQVLDRGKELIERGRKLADEASEMFERGRKLVEGAASNLQS